MNEHTITSFDGTRIWYADSGGDGPVVVLLHGACVTSRSNFGVDAGPRENLTAAAARGPSISSTLLDAGARVVALDMRGHGRSGRSPDPERYRGDTHARDAVAVIDASKAHAVDVVGYSMGSYTASRLLDREPRLRSVALCGSSSQFVEGIDQSPYGDDLCSWFRSCAHAFQTNTWDDPAHEWVRQVAVRDPRHDFPSIAAALFGFDPVPAERLSSARVPVLVLNGGEDDAADGAKRLAALIPGAEAAVVGSGDHGTAIEDPAYRATLLAFLRRGWPR